MGFADYIIKSGIARRAADQGAKVVETMSKVANVEAKVVTGMESLGDDIVKAFSKPQSEGFVRQATVESQQSVRHAGDTFAQIPKTCVAPSTRVDAREATIQAKTATSSRQATEPFGDVLPFENPVINEIDDFWNERMSQHANDYLDNLYKTFDDNFGLGF